MLPFYLPIPIPISTSTFILIQSRLLFYSKLSQHDKKKTNDVGYPAALEVNVQQILV